MLVTQKMLGPKKGGSKKLEEILGPYSTACRMIVRNGEKFKVSKSVWEKKKDGTYGYKQTKQTKYRCRYKGLPIPTMVFLRLSWERRLQI